MNQTYDFDFAIAGGGPAGTSTAIALAQRGYQVVLFERDKFPRFHIGESLLATANDSFRALGVEKQIEAACFPEKWGAKLLTHDGGSGRGVDFTAVRDVTPRTWQVCREEFDRILMERAREVGVHVREEHRVLSSEFDKEGATVTVIPNEGEQTTLRVRAIVDATGRAGMLARKFELRVDEPMLENIAIFAHYTGVPRLDGPKPDDIRLIACADAGWWWVIPIAKKLTSVGVVMPRTLFQQMPGPTNEERMEQAIASTPAVAELMKNAKREWPVRVEKDFSYSARKYAGDRWLLVGDAGSFLDPVFSTGVCIAMESGIEAAAELDRAVRQNRFSERAFAKFSRRQQKRFERFRRFVVGFYNPFFREIFFDPHPPTPVFGAVVEILAGRWDVSLRTLLLHQVFFGMVRLQKFLKLSPVRIRSDEAAGYPAP